MVISRRVSSGQCFGTAGTRLSWVSGLRLEVRIASCCSLGPSAASILVMALALQGAMLLGQMTFKLDHILYALTAHAGFKQA